MVGRVCRGSAVTIAFAALAWGAAPAGAQQRVTLDDAVARALAAAPELASARADSLASRADLAAARAYPNPSLALDYSKSPPQHHVELEQPIEYPWVRGPRIAGARFDVEAARLRLDVARGRTWYEAVSTFVEAATAASVLELSREDAAAGEELVRIAEARRDAGDVADLDVDLARVNAARLRSTLLEDSIASVDARLRLQSLMGLPTDSVTIVVVVPDSAIRTTASPLGGDTTPAVASALAAGRAADRRLVAARRGRIPAPAIRAGFEQGDPSGSESGILPTIGVSVAIPLFDRGGAALQQALADSARAAAELAAARRDQALARARAARELDLARARLDADRQALQAAERVADLSIEAYRRGAYSLGDVIEARRSARDARRDYLTALGALRGAAAAAELARTTGVQP